MFAAKNCLKSAAAAGTRTYSRGTAPLPLPVREVMVSQSRDLVRNTALEDWAVRNVDLQSKNILILTNNLSLSPTNETVLDIKATLLDSDVVSKAAEFEELVLSSLPSSLLLSALPDLERGRALLEPGALGHSVRLQLDKGVGAKAVLEALHSIAKAFLKDHHTVKRFGLVRPDDGWFQGLEATRTELETTMTTGSKAMAVLARKAAKTKGMEAIPRARGEGRGLQNSYGI